MSEQLKAPPPLPGGSPGRDGPWRRFFRRYSPHGELPWSSATSLIMHAFFLVVVVVVAVPLMRSDPTPPAVDVLYVSTDETAAPDEGDGLPSDATLEGRAEESPEDMPDELPVSDVAEIPAADPEQIVIDPVDQGTELREETSKAQAALDRLARARQQLADNLNRGKATGSGGGGGGGPAGRGARVARWILHFNSRSAKHYLAQLDGLGAVVAFPVEAEQWRYYSDIASTDFKTEVRDLSGETRLYWVDGKPESINGVAQHFGIAPSPYMIVFLPLDMEERLLEMELAYRNLREEEILKTEFEVTHRGGNYDVKIMRQTPK